jgi:predicted dehydrogenase
LKPRLSGVPKSKGKGKLKIALVGCGFIAATHARVLNEMGIGIELCIGRNPDTLREFAGRWKAKRYSVCEDEALAAGIDAVHICTPPALHYSLAKKCLEAGKHVLCEKPLCLDTGEARELAELAERTGRVNVVNFNVRFHSACLRMAPFVQSGEFGQVRLIHGSYLQEFNAYPAPYDWRYKPELAGPMRAVTEIGSHWFDLAQFISGRQITAVQADFGNFGPVRYLKDGILTPADDGAGPAHDTGAEKITVSSEDAALIHLRFDNGALGSVVLSEVSQGRINRLSLEISGEKASLWWNSEDNNLIHTGRKDRGIQTEVLGFGSGFTDTERVLFEKVYAVMQAKPSLQAEVPPDYADFKQAARITALCSASRESALNRGRWVSPDF